MGTIGLFLTLPLYGLFIYLFWLRVQTSLYNIEIGSKKTILMWLNEILFTLILPIIGFIMINDGNGIGTFSDVNRNGLFQIPEAYKYYYYGFSGVTVLVYLILRILSVKKINLPLIKKLAVIPLISSVFTCMWLGFSLGYGLLPILITLPVISPLVSTLYILLLMNDKKLNTKTYDSNIVDEHLTHIN